MCPIAPTIPCLLQNVNVIGFSDDVRRVQTSCMQSSSVSRTNRTLAPPYTHKDARQSIESRKRKKEKKKRRGNTLYYPSFHFIPQKQYGDAARISYSLLLERHDAIA